MPLITLPSETVIKILGLTEPIDIRRCQMVCQKLRALVASSSYLQYILELDASGYTMPLFIRSDLGYDGMIQRLREHRSGWEDPSSCEPEFIELSPQPAISTYFAGGIFAYGYASNSVNARADAMDTIHFHQLQSKNQPTRYRHWYHDDFGFPIEEFTFQPEIDLLVLIEGIILEQEDIAEDYAYFERPFKSYRLHFRTMSTNDPHWLAGLPVIDTGLISGGRLRERKFYETRIIISIYGRKVMLRSGADHERAKNAIIVWDWIEGTEILRIGIPLGHIHSHYYSYLLSEDHLLVSRPATALDAIVIGLGFLDIYHLGSKSGEARTIVTFELPTLRMPNLKRYVRIASGPTRVPYTPYWLAQLDHKTSVYEVAPQDRLLIVLFCIPKPYDSRQHYFHSLLHIPVQILLNHLKTTPDDQPNIIAWGAWSAKVTWIDIISNVLPRLFSLSGMRISIRNLDYYLPRLGSNGQDVQECIDQLAILDFGSHRLGHTQSIGKKQTNGVNSSNSINSEVASSTVFMTCQDALGHPRFETPVNMAPLYRKLHVHKDFLPAEVTYNKPCMIDDEHVVIITGADAESSARSGIYIYTF